MTFSERRVKHPLLARHPTQASPPSSTAGLCPQMSSLLLSRIRARRAAPRAGDAAYAWVHLQQEPFTSDAFGGERLQRGRTPAIPRAPESGEGQGSGSCGREKPGAFRAHVKIPALEGSAVSMGNAWVGCRPLHNQACGRTIAAEPGPYLPPIRLLLTRAVPPSPG